jgi:hypothetical protein
LDLQPSSKSNTEHDREVGDKLVQPYLLPPSLGPEQHWQICKVGQ